MLVVNEIHSVLKQLTSAYHQADVVCVASESVLHKQPALTDFTFPVLALSEGEANKSIVTLEKIWDFLLDHAITRRGLLICVGGGVVTDIGGFAAATYKRGIDYINIPTTLLAMVDASTGGKTGFNYGGIKNGVGAFHMPVETIICPAFLTTLPAQEILSGFAEMFKTGLVDSTKSLWTKLLQYDLERMDINALTPLITESIGVKQRIVDQDPHETGMRKALNFGHTFGHALEEMNIGRMNHGYAVLYGMIAELYLSVTMIGCPREPLQQLTQRMLHVYGRPNCNCKDRDRLIAFMRQDKKNERTSEINCTLLKEIGLPAINQIISPDQANEALDYLFSV